jgi:hypothetical protein
MEFNLPREQWLERFVARASRLDGGSTPSQLAELATTLWPMRGQTPPEAAAEAEFAGRHAVVTDAADDTPRFDRTERFAGGDNAAARVAGTAATGSPAAGQGSAEPAATPAAFDDSHRFERTERIPVERVQTADEYVRDNEEWINRCVRRVLQLDPIIKADEAQRSVTDLAALDRWRLMKPEAAAEQLYTPIKPRQG